MSTTTNRRALRTSIAALLLALIAVLSFAGAALAAAPDAVTGGALVVSPDVVNGGSKPGTPAAVTPTGAGIDSMPVFTWSGARGAAGYELRVYYGRQLLLKKTGLKKKSWTSVQALPASLPLTWKVRASNARGPGAWSRSLAFTIVQLAIGDSFGGGKVAYILRPGDTGYVAGRTHGLIAAAADQTSDSGIRWALPADQSAAVAGATSTAIGSGAANTTAIVAQNGAGTDYAAGLARACRSGGYSDWYLPSKDELRLLWLNRIVIGGFHTSTSPPGLPYYWSSSQELGTAGVAWHEYFVTGTSSTYSKGGTFRVRAVRSF